MRHGYIIVSQGEVAVTDSNQAHAIATATDPVYTLESPSPRIVRRPRGSIPIARSAQHSASTPSATSATAPQASSISGTRTPPVRPLSIAEKDRFAIAPEVIASVDNSLMETIFGTITSIPTRQA
eukprot:1146322-Pleurochrysis_carterae.AAC.2